MRTMYTCGSSNHKREKIFFLAYIAMKAVCILINWLLKKPADVDLHCFKMSIRVLRKLCA